MAPPQTFGPKPTAFKLSGETYYIGADVGNYLKCHRGKLYKFYPNMWKRTATSDEKKEIASLLTGPGVSSNVMLVRAEEVDEIIAGNDEKYRSRGADRNGTPMTISSTPNVRKDSTPLIGSRVTRSSGAPSWFNSHVSFLNIFNFIHI